MGKHIETLTYDDNKPVTGLKGLLMHRDNSLKNILAFQENKEANSPLTPEDEVRFQAHYSESLKQHEDCSRDISTILTHQALGILASIESDTSLYAAYKQHGYGGEDYTNALSTKLDEQNVTDPGLRSAIQEALGCNYSINSSRERMAGEQRFR